MDLTRKGHGTSGTTLHIANLNTTTKHTLIPNLNDGTNDTIDQMHHPNEFQIRNIIN